MVYLALMGKAVSIESRFMRLGLAMAMTGTLISCRPKSKEEKPPVLPCGAGEFYPPEGSEVPQTAIYYVEVPTEKGCAVEIYLDKYRAIFVIIYTDRMEFVVWENQVEEYSVQTGPLPDDGDKVNFSWGGIVGSVERKDDTYIVWYSVSNSSEPTAPGLPPTLPDFRQRHILGDWS